MDIERTGDHERASGKPADGRYREWDGVIHGFLMRVAVMALCAPAASIALDLPQEIAASDAGTCSAIDTNREAALREDHPLEVIDEDRVPLFVDDIRIEGQMQA